MSSEQPRQGELYFAELEDIGRKLVLVLSNDAVNKVLHPIVCLVTSTDRERALPTFVLIEPPEGGVWKPSAILCHAILTIERWRLADLPIGQLSTGTVEKVRAALNVVFEARDEADHAEPGTNGAGT